MNVEEVAKLYLMARTAFSAQKFAEHTPDLWGELFADYPYADMRAALMWCTRNKEWLNVKDMLAEVKRIRAKRINEDTLHKLYPPDDLDPDNPRAYIDWLVTQVRALGDGVEPAEPPALVARADADPARIGAREVRALVAGFRDVPDADTEEAS